MKYALFSVWCDDLGRWCGMSPFHRLETSHRPFASMMSTDIVVARLRARSLAREFPKHIFTAKEV